MRTADLSKGLARELTCRGGLGKEIGMWKGEMVKKKEVNPVQRVEHLWKSVLGHSGCRPGEQGRGCDREGDRCCGAWERDFSSGEFEFP